MFVGNLRANGRSIMNVVQIELFARVGGYYILNSAKMMHTPSQPTMQRRRGVIPYADQNRYKFPIKHTNLLSNLLHIFW